MKVRYGKPPWPHTHAKPIDERLILEAARETGCMVTVENHSVIGGLGSAVSEVTAENYPVPVIKVGIQR